MGLLWLLWWLMLLIPCLCIMCVCLALHTNYLPLSISAKCWILCGNSRRMPKHLQALQWTFVPHVEGKRQLRLMVAFSGGAVKLGGIPMHEFVATAQQVDDCDVLFVSDPRQLWYFDNYESFHTRLKNMVEPYESVLFIGNCMGASGALLFSHLATHVLAFAAQTSLIHLEGRYRLFSYRLSSHKRHTFHDMMSTNMSQCKGSIHIYYSPIKDTQFMSNVPLFPHVTCKIIQECNHHTVPQWLKKNNSLVSFIQQHWNIKSTQQMELISTKEE